MAKTTLKKLLCGAVFGVAALAGLALLNWLVVDDVHSYTRLMMSEMYNSEQNIDVLFLGPSHCYRAYDPDLATQRLGLNCFNGGSSQQMLDGSYQMLVETAKTNELKQVYLECFYGTFLFQQSDELPQAAYLLTDFMKPSADKYGYLYRMGGLAALFDDLLPARHNTISPSDILTTWKAKLTDGYAPGNYAYVTYPEEEYRGRGFVYVNTQDGADTRFEQLYGVDETQPITPFAREYLDKITEFCAENGIQLVFVTAPLPTALLADTPSYQYFVDYMRAYAGENSTEYWDFGLAKPELLQGISYEDFSDSHHLSGLGAEKFTDAFCTLVRARTAGQDTGGCFYDTVTQKISAAPDGTPAAKGA